MREIQTPDATTSYSLEEIASEPKFDLFRQLISEAIRLIPSPIKPSFQANGLLVYEGGNFRVCEQGQPERWIRGFVKVTKAPGSNDPIRFIHLSQEGFQSTKVVWEEICHCLHRGSRLGPPKDDLLGHVEIFCTFCVSSFFKQASLLDQDDVVGILELRLGGLDTRELNGELDRTGRSAIRLKWREMLRDFRSSAQFGQLSRAVRGIVDRAIGVLT